MSQASWMEAKNATLQELMHQKATRLAHQIAERCPGHRATSPNLAIKRAAAFAIPETAMATTPLTQITSITRSTMPPLSRRLRTWRLYQDQLKRFSLQLHHKCKPSINANKIQIAWRHHAPRLITRLATKSTMTPKNKILHPWNIRTHQKLMIPATMTIRELFALSSHLSCLQVMKR